MAKIIQLNNNRKRESNGRTMKVTLTTLALAMEYYTKVVPDLPFVQEARLCLLTYDNDLVCLITPEMYVKVSENMPVNSAVKNLLYA